MAATTPIGIALDDHSPRRDFVADAKEASIVALVSAVLVAAIIAVMVVFLLTGPADARGFDWFFAHVKPSGACPGREIAVSHYWTGRHTASGERFYPNGNTAASRTLPFGTVIALTNPRNGRTVSVRINDRGPYGPAHRLGVKLDIARGAAQRLGMTQTGWVCAS